MMAEKKKIVFKQVIAALLDMRQPFPPSLLHQFSDINPEDLASLKQSWVEITPERKINLLEDLELIAESDTLVNFDDVGKFAMTDSLPAVRIIATRLLWECSEPKLIPTFIEMVEKDSDEVVRATAATALGQYVYMGEIEEISELMLKKIVEKLLAIVNGADKPIVRRRALESLGYSSHDLIPPLLRKYIDSNEPEWVASSLFAMGRSLNLKWKSVIARFLSNSDTQIQLEAVRAAGNLEFKEASEMLMEMLKEDDLDEEVRMAVIWSLSQIGGEGVRDLLEELFDQAEDDEEAELIEEALDNLAFTDMAGDLSMMDIDASDDEMNDLLNVDGLDEFEEKKQSRKRHKPKG